MKRLWRAIKAFLKVLRGGEEVGPRWKYLVFFESLRTNKLLAVPLSGLEEKVGVSAFSPGPGGPIFSICGIIGSEHQLVLWLEARTNFSFKLGEDYLTTRRLASGQVFSFYVGDYRFHGYTDDIGFHSI